ncbi:MAG TPA: response regulator [Candidatus Binatia bacterium]|nr:response regulator [Candidatus Binatia bacterium]
MATILIVDDEKNIRTHLATYVRGRKHRVEVAADAPEALAILEKTDIEVVFSDVRMAGMDGLALLREIRQRRPEAVVVLMTAYATVAGAVEAMRAGAYDYLVKPFALDEVGLLLSASSRCRVSGARTARSAARSSSRRSSTRSIPRCSACWRRRARSRPPT